MNTEKVKHTPGPWKLGSNGESAKNHAICADNKVIGIVYGNGYPIGKGWSPDSQANARLIAEAPAMFQALKDLFANCAMIHMYGGEIDNTKEADIAIKNAEQIISQIEGKGEINEK